MAHLICQVRRSVIVMSSLRSAFVSIDFSSSSVWVCLFNSRRTWTWTHDYWIFISHVQSARYTSHLRPNTRLTTMMADPSPHHQPTQTDYYAPETPPGVRSWRHQFACWRSKSGPGGHNARRYWPRDVTHVANGGKTIHCLAVRQENAVSRCTRLNNRNWCKSEFRRLQKNVLTGIVSVTFSLMTSRVLSGDQVLDDRVQWMDSDAQRTSEDHWKPWDGV